MLLRLLRSKLFTEAYQSDDLDQTLSRLNKQLMISQVNPLEITNQSLLKNLREATISDTIDLKRKSEIASDTPQFDQFQHRKSNFAILDELKDAIQSYSD